MNERSMQFQIGIFAIVAGMVLVFLIIWFGERPSLLRDQLFLTIHFDQAPGVTDGVPVRKSGIRIGEVSAIEFDHREGHDGVLVTIALDKRRKTFETARPRISRSLIGDVAIDMIPDPTGGELPLSDTQQAAMGRIVEGDSPIDPTKALEAASAAIEKVGGTLASIKAAADRIDLVASKAENLDEFLVTWGQAGKQLNVVAADLHRVVEANEGDIKPTITSLRQVVQKVDAVLDNDTQGGLKTTLAKLQSAAGRIDEIAESVQPLAKDLSADPSKKTTPATNLGSLLVRMNRVVFDVSLLTEQLYDPRGGRDGKGGLSTKGSLQRLLTNSELHDNANGAVVSAQEIFASLRPILGNLKKFSDKIASNPSELTRGALRP